MSARVGAGAVLCVAVLGMSGCQSIVSGTTEPSQVRFVDTSVDAPPLDLYVNGTGAAYSLGYATFSSYVDVTPGASLVSANRANSSQAVVNAHTALLSGRQYTAVVSNHLGNLQESLYPDVAPSTEPGMISVRVLDEADTSPLDVYLVPTAGSLALSSPLASGLGYMSATGYEHLAANTTYTVAALPAHALPSAASVVTVSGVTVTGAPGAVRTVVLADSSKIEGRSVYAFVLNDSETE